MARAVTSSIVGLKLGAGGRKLKFFDIRLQTQKMGVLKISILPQDSPEMGDFQSQVFFILE